MSTPSNAPTPSFGTGGPSGPSSGHRFASTESLFVEILAANANAAAEKAAEAATSFHVALDTLSGRRRRMAPDEVLIPGFLMLDSGDFVLVEARIPLAIFWRMQGMDILGNSRSRHAAMRLPRGAKPPSVASVWLVDGVLGKNLPGEVWGFNLSNPDGGAAKEADPIFRFDVLALHALERIELRARSARCEDAIDIWTMLPGFRDDAAG